MAHKEKATFTLRLELSSKEQDFYSLDSGSSCDSTLELSAQEEDFDSGSSSDLTPELSAQELDFDSTQVNIYKLFIIINNFRCN